MSGAIGLGEDVSRETAARLDVYEALLRKWQGAINLVSASTLPDLRTRHFADSAQLLQFTPQEARHWVDLGSGGGFPGLVVAALAAQKAPQLRVTLIESDTRKATFLRLAAQDMGLEVTVLAQRAEEAAPQNADIVSARALAPLSALVPLAARHLAPHGIALFPKGARYEEELNAALASTALDVQTHPSQTAPDAVILRIGGLARD